MLSSARALAAFAMLMFVLSAESAFTNKLGLRAGRRSPSYAKLRRSVDHKTCAKPPLAIALSATSSELTPDGTPILDVSADDSKFVLTLTVANPSQRTITFLKRGTPFEGFVTNSFVISAMGDGTTMGYLGPDVKHAREIHANEYVILGPGASVSQSVTLAGVYELGDDGLYIVTYTAGVEWTDGDQAGNYEGVQFCHTQVEKPDKGLNRMVEVVKVQGTAAYTARQQDRQSRRLADAHRTRDATRRSGSRRWSHEGCSDDQVAQLDSWIKDSEQKVDYARACTECSCADLVDTWFGPATSQSTFKLVTDKFDIMREKMDDSIYKCEPDGPDSPVCNGNYFAYVYPSDSSQKVYMCEFTFNYPEYYEKVVTVIHELSHFNTIAGTTDAGLSPDEPAYGEQTCYDLAQSNPELALEVADNYAYFATFSNTCYENGPNDYLAPPGVCALCSAATETGRVDQNCSTLLPSDNGAVCPEFTMPPTPPPPPCNDEPAGWYDSDGPVYDCDWYSLGSRCSTVGYGYANMGSTASQACCACGGGVDATNGGEPNTVATMEPTTTMEPPWGSASGSGMTMEPTSLLWGSASGSGSAWPTMAPNNCEDVDGWYDSDGPSYDCRWYSYGDRCDDYGFYFENNGLTASQACCACGGGIGGIFSTAPGQYPSWAPGTASGSGYPTMNPTPSSSGCPEFGGRTTCEETCCSESSCDSCCCDDNGFGPTGPTGPGYTPCCPNGNGTVPTMHPTMGGSGSGGGSGGGSGNGSYYPTMAPTNSGSGMCVDDPVGWHDSDGWTFHCGWYSMGAACDRYGDGYENMGSTANQACCVCGGGRELSTQIRIENCSTLNTVFEEQFECCGNPHKELGRSIVNYNANNAIYNVAKCKDLKAIYRSHHCCQADDKWLNMTLL